MVESDLMAAHNTVTFKTGDRMTQAQLKEWSTLEKGWPGLELGVVRNCRVGACEDPREDSWRVPGVGGESASARLQAVCTRWFFSCEARTVAECLNKA